MVPSTQRKAQSVQLHNMSSLMMAGFLSVVEVEYIIVSLLDHTSEGHFGSFAMNYSKSDGLKSNPAINLNIILH